MMAERGVVVAGRCSAQSTIDPVYKLGFDTGRSHAMTFEATAIKVMIASPSDVTAERQIIRDTIAVWNAVHAEDRRQVLLPIGWDTHASPELGDRPQEFINNQLLKTSDILVAVFWTKLGSSTGKFASGTVEEIEEHVNAGKTAMLYFSNAPVRMDSVDNAQYESLKDFKKQCRDRGLYEEFEESGEFKTKFERQLTQKVIEKYVPNKSSIEAPVETRVTLSAEARNLLLAAAHPNIGRIVRTKSKYFVGDVAAFDGNDLRTIAKWRAAVESLEQINAIKPEGGRGYLWSVTQFGYELADKIRLQGVDEVDRMIHRLDDQERNYLLTASRPRNHDALSLSFFDHGHSPESARYIEMLEKFDDLELMRFDGSQYRLKPFGFKVADRMWHVALLRSIEQNQADEYQYADAEQCKLALQLTDPDEGPELQRFLKVLANANYVEAVPVDGGIGGARITPVGRSFLRNYSDLKIDVSSP
jgi:hypothetical protein